MIEFPQLSQEELDKLSTAQKLIWLQAIEAYTERTVAHSEAMTAGLNLLKEAKQMWIAINKFSDEYEKHFFRSLFLPKYVREFYATTWKLREYNGEEE
ncbi:MAG: hypothetical protein WDA59_07915 [Methanofastidiosum sp.]